MAHYQCEVMSGSHKGEERQACRRSKQHTNMARVGRSPKFALGHRDGHEKGQKKCEILHDLDGAQTHPKPTSAFAFGVMTIAAKRWFLPMPFGRLLP